MTKMIVSKGVQYTREDAERLGIKADSEIETQDSTIGTVIRAGEPADNKARTVSSGTTRPARGQKADGDTA